MTSGVSLSRRRIVPSGAVATLVSMVIEIVSLGKRNQDRDRIRKRREYARAGIPVYLLIDDYDGQGAVTLFTGPRPDKADWEAS